MAVLWIWSVLMYLILLWDLPRKAVNFVSNINRLRKSRKKQSQK